MTSKERQNEARYDQEATVYVGPPSDVLNIDEVARSPFLALPAQETVGYTRELSASSRAALAARCSTKDVQDEVKRCMRDQDIVQLLRKRLSAWAADETDEGSSHQAGVCRSNKTRRVQSERKKAVDQENETVLDDIDALIPDAFKIYAHPLMASVYHQRETLLEQNCVGKPVMSSLLSGRGEETLSSQQREGTSTIPSEAVQMRHRPPLVLSISIYARPLRGMWAKEKVQRTLKGGTDDDPFDDSASDQSSQNSQNLKEKSARTKAERGLYGPLQLVQCIEVPSDTTLQQVRDMFLCRMDQLPDPVKGIVPDAQSINERMRKTDSCFLIEDTLYSESTASNAYAVLLSKHLAAKPSECPMAGFKIGSLSLQLGKLYWFLHRGSCEHVWSITSVRALRQGENEQEQRDLPRCTFYASGAAVRPLSRWTRAKNVLTRSTTLDKCDLCDRRQAKKLVIGGSRVRFKATNLDGFQEDVTPVCDECLSKLTLDEKFATSSSSLSEQTPSTTLEGIVIGATD